MSKLCVMRLTPDEVCLNVCEDGTSPVGWAELARRHFFTEYLVIGVSDEQNKIYLEFDAPMLGKSLASLKQTARSTKIKLTNKQRPCLTVEVDLPTLSNDSWQCVHDVPVRVIPRKEWPLYEGPTDLPLFDISIDLPNLKHIRNVVERMKNMSPQLTMSANNEGTFVLKIDTDCASVATHFQGLRVISSATTAGEPPDHRITATIDARRFLTFLAWEVVHPEGVKCNITDQRIIYLSININDNVKIHYFIPAIAM